MRMVALVVLAGSLLGVQPLFAAHQHAAACESSTCCCPSPHCVKQLTRTLKLTVGQQKKLATLIKTCKHHCPK